MIAGFIPLMEHLIAMPADDLSRLELVEADQGLIDQGDAQLPVVEGQRVGDAVEKPVENSSLVLDHRGSPSAEIQVGWKSLYKGVSYNWTKGVEMKSY